MHLFQYIQYFLAPPPGLRPVSLLPSTLSWLRPLVINYFQLNAIQKIYVLQCSTQYTLYALKSRLVGADNSSPLN